jgi:hypothetical protein
MEAAGRFGMLLWIEFKRCQGVFVAPVLAALMIWLVKERIDHEGVVLWRDVSLYIGQWAWIVGSGGAGFAVWVVNRARRRKMGEQEAIVPVSQGRTTVLSLLAVLAWSLIAYAAVFVWFAIPAVRFATWGGPDWPLLLIGVLTIAVCVGIGGVIGWFGYAPILAPLTVLGVYGGIAGAAGLSYDNPIALLSPYRFFEDFRIYGRFSIPSDLVWSMIGWLAALSLLLGGVVMLQRQQSLVRMGTGVIALVLVIASANQVMAERSAPRDFRPPEMDLAELDCREAVIEVCVHPAYSALLDEFVDAVNQTYEPLMGLPGLPERAIGGEVYLGDLDPGKTAVAYFKDGWNLKLAVTSSLADVIWHGSEKGGPMTASQCVVVMGISPSDVFNPCTLGMVREAWVERQPGGPWTSNDSEWNPRIKAKIASFRAMTDDERREWVEANWDALRAGEIPLEDMP